MMVPEHDEDLVAAITASMTLRPPNAEALNTVAALAADHFAGENPGMFEGVIDVATGVGKTFVIGAVIDYFAAQGFRNFAVITPGRTVMRKTLANFTPGHPKVLPGMEVRPFVVTAETFDRPEVAAAFDDDTVVKLSIFTVQALLTPTSRADRRTHEFQEHLGAAFYQRLKDAADLVVLADESHLYAARRFSESVRGLEPQMLLGLTATPKRDDPIIYRYPLAAAIADGFVKTPVLVGRPDDRTDFYTKVTDGLRLLDGKRRAVDAYLADHPGADPTNPVMLIVAPDTHAADEVVGILKHPNFFEGQYAETILNIHSDVDDPEDALAKLDAVEDPTSPVRVIVSVAMLKEGWDVKNVYVICSLRASVSEILTEQTLGRGLRLPFGGRPTRNEMLDTLEVVAHERYDALIRRIDRMREEFVDYRTVLEAAGVKQEPAALPIAEGEAGTAIPGAATITNTAERIGHTEDVVAAMTGEELHPRTDVGPMVLPVVTSFVVEQPFSLAEITDLGQFRTEGRRIAATPEDRLRRTIIEGNVVTDAEGRRSARLRRRAAGEDVASAAQVTPLADSRARLVADIMASGCVPDRQGQTAHLNRMVDALVEGLGDKAEVALAAFPQRAAEAIVGRIRAHLSGRQPLTKLADEIEMRPFTTVRHGRPTVLTRGDPFSRGVGYSGFTKSLYPQDWFDSGTAEFAAAQIIDDSPDVAYWLRLQRGDLPLPWQGDERAYNPDFVVVDNASAHWVLETKADDMADHAEVAAKREAARQWAAHVTALTGEAWGYLLVTETDIASSRGSWAALKQRALPD
jgi:type III restriction enzyme